MPVIAQLPLTESAGRHVAEAEEDGRALLAEPETDAEAEDESAEIRMRMEASASGCRWLLGRLALLTGRLAAGLAWDEESKEGRGIGPFS